MIFLIDKLKNFYDGRGIQVFSTKKSVAFRTSADIKHLTSFPIIEKKKQRLMNESLVIHKDISIIDSGVNYYGLERNTIDDYSSDIFSKLRYEDLKKAHTETVVPVSNKNFKNKNIYKQYEKIKMDRGTRINVLSMEESKNKLL